MNTPSTGDRARWDAVERAARRDPADYPHLGSFKSHVTREEVLELIADLRAYALQSLAEEDAQQRDAARWRAFAVVSTVVGAGWSVRHPRTEGEPFHVGFSWPMTKDEVLDAVERGGLGFAPTLATMLENAAATLRARAGAP